MLNITKNESPNITFKHLNNTRFFQLFSKDFLFQCHVHKEYDFMHCEIYVLIFSLPWQDAVDWGLWLQGFQLYIFSTIGGCWQFVLLLWKYCTNISRKSLSASENQVSWAAFFTTEYQECSFSSSVFHILGFFWPVIQSRGLCWEFLVLEHVIKGAVGCSKWTHIWLSLSMLAFMMQNKSSAWSKVGQWDFPHVPAVSLLLKKPWSSH